jgi:signal transduction histidine kinase
VGTAIDITERKADEARLHDLYENLERRVAEALAERKLLVDIIDGTDLFVQVASTDFTWLAINRASSAEFARIFGVARPQAGDNMLEMLADRPEHQAAVRAVWSRALAGEEFIEVGQFGDPGRDRRYYEARFRTLYNAEGEPIGAYQFASDVTERIGEQARLREAEDALQQGQKMQALGQLAGGIAHDFNNLLGAIVGSLDLVLNRSQLDERTRRSISNAFTAAKRGSRLTAQLLAFARAQKIELRPLLVSELVERMRELLARTLGPNIDLRLDMDKVRAPVLSDPTQLEMAVLNLAINARDAMPEGGTLTIRKHVVQMENDPELAPGEYVELSVSDNGTGMPAEIAARAFDPFFTTKNVGEGTGLGLSQVYGIARQAGGTARISTRPGDGTTVSLFLRRTTMLAEAEEPEPIANLHGAARSATILIVDDDAGMRQVLAESLDVLGYTVISAASGPEGMEMVRARGIPDLAIIDFAMPGMNGAELAAAVRNMAPDLPILFASGYANTDALGNLAEDGAMLRKPFGLEELRLAVERRLTA